MKAFIWCGMISHGTVIWLYALACDIEEARTKIMSRDFIGFEGEKHSIKMFVANTDPKIRPVIDNMTEGDLLIGEKYFNEKFNIKKPLT